MTTSEIGKITGYHAHIYYHSETRETAAKIRDALDAKFRGAIRLGRWHDKNIGPHTRSMYQVAFDRTVFPEIVPWLVLNRDGLTISCIRKAATVLPIIRPMRCGWARCLRLTKAFLINKTYLISFSSRNITVFIRITLAKRLVVLSVRVTMFCAEKATHCE